MAYPHIDIPMKKSDILDRWTILLMKSRHEPTAKMELDAMDQAAIRIVDEMWADGTREHQGAIMQLMEANAKIWVLEASIRKECPSDAQANEVLSMEEVGRRTIQIREHNKLRIQAKEVIEQFFGGFPDKKVDHASA